MSSADNITKGAPYKVYIAGRDIGYCEKASINYKLLEDAVKLGCPKSLVTKLPEEIESGCKVTALEVLDPTNISDALGGLEMTDDYTVDDFSVDHLSTLLDGSSTGTYIGLGSSFVKDEPSFTLVHKHPKTQLYFFVHYWKSNISLASEFELGDAVAKMDLQVDSLEDADHSPDLHGVWWWETTSE